MRMQHLDSNYLNSVNYNKKSEEIGKKKSFVIPEIVLYLG